MCGVLPEEANAGVQYIHQPAGTRAWWSCRSIDVRSNRSLVVVATVLMQQSTVIVAVDA